MPIVGCGDLRKRSGEVQNVAERMGNGWDQIWPEPEGTRHALRYRALRYHAAEPEGTHAFVLYGARCTNLKLDSCKGTALLAFCTKPVSRTKAAPAPFFLGNLAC